MKLKSLLLDMGFSQVHILDFSEIFSPRIWLETLHLLLALLGHKNWVGHQIDFKTAFLNRKLYNLVYMSQPPGFKDPTHLDWVFKVTWAIYGLKQSQWQWNLELDTALVSLGLQKSSYDPLLYFRLEGGCLVGAIMAHVDDLVVVGRPDFVAYFVQSIKTKFQVVSDEDIHLHSMGKTVQDGLARPGALHQFYLPILPSSR